MAALGGTLDAPLRRRSAPFFSRSRRSLLNWCAGSVNEGLYRTRSVEGVPLPTKDGPIPVWVGRHLRFGRSRTTPLPDLVTE